MIQIEEVKDIPDLNFTDWANEEVKVAKAYTPLWSPKMWLISSILPLFVCGVYQPSLLTPPELWVLMCRDGEKRPMAAVRTALRLFPVLLNHYPHVIARAPVDAVKSRRLIEIAGFRLVAEKDGFANYEARK